jgi:hypothetical protein
VYMRYVKFLAIATEFSCLRLLLRRETTHALPPR